MFTNRFVTITLTLVVTMTTALNADGEDAPPESASVEFFPLPADRTFERHVVGEGVPTTAAGERLVYSNTLGTFGAAPGTNRLLADDISINAPNGCQLRRYEFPVVGKVNPAGTGGSYTVDFVMYRSCPGSVPAANRPLLIIPGTQGQLTFTDQCQNATDNDGDTVVNDGCPAVGTAETDAQCENAVDDDGDGKVNDGCPAIADPETDVDGVPRLISFVAAPDTWLETNMWFGVKFSRNNAGVIVGAPAVTGFSCDVWDYPGFPCSATLGGFPEYPHASLNLEIFADAECAESHAGYKNDKPSGTLYNPGAEVFLADDIQLGVNECQMIAYEVALRGQGLYTFKMQNNCVTGIIAGTERNWSQPNNSDVKIARFTFDPPIALPGNLWFEATVNNSTGSVIISGIQACIGSTGDLLYTVVNDTCPEVPPEHYGFGIQGAIDLAITCAGTPPVGACCDMIFNDENGEAVCREVPQMNCPWPWPQYTSPDQPQWIEAASCDPDPFPFPCGAAACCRPDQVCENLTQNECNAVPPLESPRQWQIGRYCDQNEQRCPWVACLAREGDCVITHQEPGCDDPYCCTQVCESDNYCCIVEWDRVCVEHATELCPEYAAHDECHNTLPRRSALLVEADSSTFFANTYATDSVGDPGFCCLGDTPDATGFGTVWFKFVATNTSARVSICNSDPANDSLL